jgi:low temperature requirement protein LtrA
MMKKRKKKTNNLKLFFLSFIFSFIALVSLFLIFKTQFVNFLNQHLQEKQKNPKQNSPQNDFYI